MNKREVGAYYEDVAKRYLTEHGVTILESNFRCKMGEIDLIGRQGDVLVFFEVKYRTDDKFGYSLEAIDKKKQKKIINCAKYYLAFNKCDCYIRFDAVGIDMDRIEWIKNAFDMS